MNTLVKLIAKLCPDGVEYKQLGEVAKVCRGVRVVKAQLTDIGTYPVYQNCITPLGYHSECNCKAGTPFVIAAGAAGEIGYSNVDYWAADDCYYIETDGKLDSRYVYYCLVTTQLQLTSKVRKASVPRLAQGFVESLEIPLPPLPVQQEIVRMLDEMSGLVDALEEELAARKKQYEWSLERLLDLDGVNYEALGTIGRVAMCKRIFQNQTSRTGDVPFYKIGTFGKTPDAYISRERFNEYKMKFSYPQKGAILLSAAGTIGRTVVFNGEDAYFQDSNIVWLEHDESVVLNKYLLYCYHLSPWKVATGGTVSRLYNQNIETAKIPLPSLPVQEEIARKLDEMTALISALEEEIALRKQQYEYYRDKLLTFKRKEKA